MLRANGFGNVDIGAAATAWTIGAIVGGIAGAAGHVLAQIGTLYGNMLGSILADKFFLGIQMLKVISQGILVKFGGLAGGFIGGFVGGKIVNFVAGETGMQDQDVPMWLISFFKFIGKMFGAS